MFRLCKDTFVTLDVQFKIWVLKQSQLKTTDLEDKQHKV